MKYILLLAVLLAAPMPSQACQEISAKELKTFKEKNGVDLNQAIQFNLSSTMTPPVDVALQWEKQQKKKWQILLPTNAISDFKVTDYRIFSCPNTMTTYYPCTKPLYQLRLQLNPKESCKTMKADQMNIAVLAVIENKSIRILDYLYETNPGTHQMTPIGLIVLEDIELTKKEQSKLR